MTAKNDVTGDRIISRSSSERYRENWERIFGKKTSSLSSNVVDGTQPHVSTNDGDESTNRSQNH